MPSYFCAGPKLSHRVSPPENIPFQNAESYCRRRPHRTQRLRACYLLLLFLVSVGCGASEKGAASLTLLLPDLRLEVMTEGFAFDPVDGGLLVSDNGPNGHDSLTKASPGDNLGWPLVWGTVDEWYERWGARWLGKGFRPPLWESFEQRSVPTAVQILVDDSYGPGMAGRVLMGEYGTESIRQLVLDEQTRRRAVGVGAFLEGLTGIVDLQFGADGRLYILTMSALHRVEIATCQTRTMTLSSRFRAATGDHRAFWRSARH